MKLNIQAREVHEVAVLDLSGKIVLGEECSSLREQVMQLLAANKNKILLNLGEVSHVDSSGIGLLVEAVLFTAKQGGQLKLVNPSRILVNTLSIARLLSAFEIYANEAEALASFNSPDVGR